MLNRSRILSHSKKREETRLIPTRIHVSNLRRIPQVPKCLIQQQNRTLLQYTYIIYKEIFWQEWTRNFCNSRA